MQKAPHFQRAFDLGMDVAEAEHHDWPLPVPRVPSSGELWAAVMGAEKRSDWPTNTLPQLRAEFDRGKLAYW